MKRKLAIAICLAFLISGLIRIGVSLVMIGQTLGWWALGGEATVALADTQRFIAEHDTNLVGFTPLSYFGFILFMGATISLGAIGQLWRKPWGLALIILYLLSHAALFLNFMTVNPKIFYLELAIVATVILVWANRVSGEDSQPLPA